VSIEGAGEQSNSDGAATAVIEDQAAYWAAASHNLKDWTSERQTELNAWLAESLAHRVAFLRINATWKRADRLAALRQPIGAPADTNATSVMRWMRIALGLAFVALAGAFARIYLQQPHSQLIETPRGGQERLTLADGSQIELNTDTAVRVAFSDSMRSVELVRGEVYFQIRHDAARSFVVYAGTHRIVDLGTKFLVRATAQSIKVALVEGRARFEDTGGQRPALVLAPGDIAVATADRTHVFKQSPGALSEDLAWQRGLVVFHNERLADAVAELNRYGGPQLIVADEDAGKLMINGTFLTGRPEQFAGATREIFGLRVENRNGTILLSR
jgi:transmembrane sensor